MGRSIFGWHFTNLLLGFRCNIWYNFVDRINDRLTGRWRRCFQIAIFGKVASDKLRQFLLSDQVKRLNRENENREYINNATRVVYRIYDWDGKIYQEHPVRETITFAFTVLQTGNFLVRVLR